MRLWLKTRLVRASARSDAFYLLVVFLFVATVIKGTAAPGSAPVKAAAMAAPQKLGTEAQREPLSKDSDKLTKRIALIDAQGTPVSPAAVLAAGNDLYFLCADAILKSSDGAHLMAGADSLTLTRIAVPGGAVAAVPVQEFLAFAYYPVRHALVVLDKAGNLFELSLKDNNWALFRANRPTTGSPDPEYLDLAIAGNHIAVLDPERNQIWQFLASGFVSRYFDEVLPWRVKPGNIYVGDGIGIASDATSVWVLKRNGSLSRYSQAQADRGAVQLPARWKRPPQMRPSRMIAGAGLPVYIVERENNRVVAFDSTKGKSRQYVFPAESDLRGLLAQPQGFFVLDGSHLVARKASEYDAPQVKPSGRRMDQRLDGMILPLAGVRLPRHPGVWPGARRLYRFGVHKGVDFFADASVTGRVVMDTPVRAVDAGKVIRADVDFKDMDARTFNRIMSECRLQHVTSDKNEDLFRGCQVWIDHGNGLVTRYAHLNGVKQGIQAGRFVSQGDTIGYVGVSGTGQNLPGHAKHPHLHFEIWLDGKYLGWGLTPTETIGVFEDIFGTGPQ